MPCSFAASSRRIQELFFSGEHHIESNVRPNRSDGEQIQGQPELNVDENSEVSCQLIT